MLKSTAAALSLLLLMFFVLPLTAQDAKDQPKPSPLWEGDAPGAQGKEAGDVPTLTLYPAPQENATGAAIVVCPGGGYGGLADDHEGKQVAAWLNKIGVTAAVLHYRLGPKYHHPVMLGDVGRAIRTVRHRAQEWKIDPQRIGVLGFSAGGHLASTAATQFDEGDPNAADPIDRVSSRPDVAILIYPVITMTDPHTHGGSRHNLLGENPDPALIEQMSSEKRVTDKTPPCFLVHSVDDGPVPPQNSLMFAEALTKHRVPFVLHMLEKGGHGYGLGGDDPILSTWPDLCARWLKGRGFLEDQP